MYLIKDTDRDARAGRTLFLHFRRSCLPLYLQKVLYACAAIFFIVAAANAAEIELKTDTATATAGYYQLAWSLPDAPAETNYLLVEIAGHDDDKNGQELYYGPDLATVISGKPDGTYHYVVRAIDAQQTVVAQSNQVDVVVAHHPLSRAFAFFILGAVVFIAILVVILRGAAKFK